MGAGPAPSVFQLAGAGEDISGSCDEAEHANDPECQGTATTDDPGSTSSTNDDGSTSTTVDATTSSTAVAAPVGALPPTRSTRSTPPAPAR